MSELYKTSGKVYSRKTQLVKANILRPYYAKLAEKFIPRKLK